MMTSAEIKAELKRLRAERKELMEWYGNRGQHHPMHRDIGGLNPAAQRLHIVRGDIERLEAMTRGPKARVQAKYPKTGYGTTARGGLLYDIEFGSRRGMIGRSQGSPPHYFYVVESGTITSDNHKTLGAAVKAFERG